MSGMEDLLAGNLELLNYEDIDLFVSALDDETSRIELKSEWPSNRELAHDLCAMANGIGGAIILGYDDPRRGCTKKTGLDGSSRKIESVLSAIQAVTSPSVRCHTRAYVGPGNHTIIVFVVESAKYGPHEYIGTDKMNLPVRHGRKKQPLTMGEIIGLQHRAEGVSNPPRTVDYPLIAINLLDGTFVGVQFSPLEWPSEPMYFTERHDTAFKHYWSTLESSWTPSLEMQLGGDLLKVSTGEPHLFAAAQVDGVVAVKWSATARPWMYFVALLEQAYEFGSLAFSTMGLAPRAHMFLRWQMKPEDAAGQRHPFPDYGQLERKVDFSRDATEDIIIFCFEQAERRIGLSRPREVVAREIAESRRRRSDHVDSRSLWGNL